VRDYIDLILLGAVVITLIPTIYHYVQSTVKARREARAGVAVDPEKLVLDPESFETNNDGKHEA